MFKILAILILLYGLVVGCLYLFQRRILFVPGTLPPDRVEAGVPDMTEILLETADGLSLLSWYHPPSAGRPTVVYFQGNAGTIADRGDKARDFIDHGYGALLVGYRGYGGNPGSPSEVGLGLDGEAALAYLADAGIPRENVVLYGESLGTGVAVSLAQGNTVSAVVLEAPYTSIREIASARYWFVPVDLLLKDPFDSIGRIGSLDVPILVLHGEQDRVISVDKGVTLFEAAAEPKRLHLFPDGGHSDLYDHGAAPVVFSFIDSVWESSRNRPAIEAAP